MKGKSYSRQPLEQHVRVRLTVAGTVSSGKGMRY